VVQVAVPWVDVGSRFTALFEALVIDWLGEASLAAVGRRLQLSWDEVDGIMSRVVARGRQVVPPRRIGVDETSFQNGPEYVTVVCDLDRDRVLRVADQHTEANLAGFYERLGAAARAGLEAIALDMWRPYIAATPMPTRLPEAPVGRRIGRGSPCSDVPRPADDSPI
jgi:transposase